MIRWGRYRKTLTIAFLGAVQVAAYIIADPGELPDWVVTVAAIVNTIGVYLVRNDRTVTRQELKRASQPTTYGGYESGSRLATEMPPPSTGIKRPDERKPPGETSFP